MKTLMHCDYSEFELQVNTNDYVIEIQNRVNGLSVKRYELTRSQVERMTCTQWEDAPHGYMFKRFVFQSKEEPKEEHGVLFCHRRKITEFDECLAKWLRGES